MRDSIILDKIVIKDETLRVEFSSKGSVAEAFKISVFEIRYDEDISTVPVSVAVIPFLANVLPIAWVYDAIIQVDELDEDFYEYIDDIKKGYKDMYPRVAFGGEIAARKLVKNKFAKKGETGLLFSGGVDATSSLITMLKDGQSPRLITLWGSDVELDDAAGWAEKMGHTKRVAKLFDLRSSVIKTNFKIFLDEPGLSSKIQRSANDRWWHGFQHGIGIIGHAAPLVYLHRLGELHIAATFVRGDVVTCASDPTIDEKLHVGNSVTVHNGYDFNRQDKIRNIHEYASGIAGLKQLPIKVCWQSRGAKNCGHCEKCIRSACGFLVEGAHLEFYDLGKFDAEYAKRFILSDYYFAPYLMPIWRSIQQRLVENGASLNKEVAESIDWIRTVNIDEINASQIKRMKHLARQIWGFILGVLPDQARISLQQIRRRD